MIVEENVLGWNNIPVKTDEVIYPQAKDDKAPKNYFLGIFCGCKGSGRSAPSPNAGSLPLLLMIIKLVCVWL